MELRKIVQIILRRKWIIIQAFWIILLVSIIVTLLMDETYEANAKILYEEKTTESSLLSEVAGLESLFATGVYSTATAIDTQIALITSRPIVGKMIYTLGLMNKEGELVKANALLKSGLLGFLKGRKIQVNQYRGTDLIQIKATSRDPEEATQIANTLANMYVEHSKKLNQEQARNARLFIEQKLATVKTDWEEAGDNLRQFREQEKIVNLGEETKVAIQKISELMAESEDKNIDIYEARTKLDTLKKQLTDTNRMQISAATTRNNPQIQELTKKLADLQIQLIGIQGEYTQNHPKTTSLERQIDETKQLLGQQVETIFSSQTTSLNPVYQDLVKKIDDAEVEVLTLEISYQAISEVVEKYLSMLETIPAKVLNQARLELALKSAEEVYKSLLGQFHDAAIAEAMSLANVRLAEPAIVPVKPKSPNRNLNGLVGAFLGTMFGFGLAFLVEYLDNTIKDTDDLKEYIEDVTVIGMIPRIPKRTGLLISNVTAMRFAGEAYKSLLYNIKLTDVDQPPKVVMITSPGPAEGKTLTTANLGIAAAQVGNNVLLIDADFPRPSLHRVFEISNSEGLTELLTGEVELDEAMQSVGIDGLSVLTSGKYPPNSSQLLESIKLRDLIERLRDEFDLIVFDTPPVLVVNDAVVLSTKVDGVALVLESRKTTHQAAVRAKEVLESVTTTILGVALNKFKAEGRGYYYYYYYSDYYSRRSEEEEQGEQQE